MLSNQRSQLLLKAYLSAGRLFLQAVCPFVLGGDGKLFQNVIHI